MMRTSSIYCTATDGNVNVIDLCAVNVNHLALETLARFVSRVARMPALSHHVDAHGRNMLLASYLAYSSAIPGTFDFGIRNHTRIYSYNCTYCTLQLHTFRTECVFTFRTRDASLLGPCNLCRLGFGTNFKNVYFHELPIINIELSS